MFLSSYYSFLIQKKKKKRWWGPGSMDKVFGGENSLWIETCGAPVVQGLYFHQKVKISTLL